MYCDVHVLYMYLRGGDRVGGGEFGPSLPKNSYFGEPCDPSKG